MKRNALILTICFVALIASECWAQPPGRESTQRRPNASGQRRPGLADPAQMVGRFIKEFDKDGDEKLDAKELTALFTALRERRGAAQGRPGANASKDAPSNSQRGQNPGANRQRRGRGNAADSAPAPGGEIPKRPPAE
jgi:hypothetical protein